MRQYRCPHCGQWIGARRAGIHLSPLKVRIFDAVKRSGSSGIDGDDLFGLIFTDRHSRHTLKAHVWQINERLKNNGWHIRGTGNRYILRNTRKAGNSRT